jgi:hypothetical protein
MHVILPVGKALNSERIPNKKKVVAYALLPPSTEWVN